MFVGRKEILQDLETLWRKRTSSIVACRGRRRIGKSTLIREFARRTADAYIEIEGLPPSAEKPMSNQDEIDHFVTVLNDQTGCGVKKVERWYDAFSLLEKQIDLLVQTPKTAYVVEVKRKNYIDTEIEAEVGMKIKRLPMRPGMTVRPVLVYAGELSKSVEADGYFDAIIPARRLLGL